MTYVITSIPRCSTTADFYSTLIVTTLFYTSPYKKGYSNKITNSQKWMIFFDITLFWQLGCHSTLVAL